MKYKSIICHFSVYLMTAVLVCIFSFSTHTVVAQVDTSTKKSAAARNNTKKIFYGQASFYANKFNGRRTAGGEIFQQSKMTCASNILKIGTWIKVTNMHNGNSVTVKVNDRLHHTMKRIVDLTTAAAKKLGFTAAGLARVKVEVLGKKKP